MVSSLKNDVNWTGSQGSDRPYWTKEELAVLLNGKWLVEPSEGWRCWDFAVGITGCIGEGTVFIAIDEQRWLQGTGNTGVYAVWEDTHSTLPRFQDKIVGAIVERQIKELDPGIPQLLVENSYAVIATLAGIAREKYLGKVLAVTGTAGKSSTRMMLHHLLEAVGSVESTRGNHNSRTGVPLNLIRAKTQPDFMLLEVAVSALWMNKGGICKLARPHICFITEVALGQAGDNVHSVKDTARMKARIAQGLEPGGIAVLNRDMQEYAFAKSEVEGYGASVVSYGFHPDSDCRVLHWQDISGGTKVTAAIKDHVISYCIPTSGRAMVSNSLAALAGVFVLGIDPREVCDRFKTFKPKDSVLQLVTAELPEGGNIHILDDTYNATVLSMLSALEVFKAKGTLYTGKKICILGRIVNLFEHAETIHRQLSGPLLECGADIVFTYGREMQYLVDELPEEIIGGFYSDIKALARDVARIVEPGDLILLKGSRRANDFGQICPLLVRAIQHKQPGIDGMLNGSIDPQYPFGLQAIDAASGEVLFTQGNPYSETDCGLGGALLLSLLIQSLALGKITLADQVTIGPAPARDAAAPRALGLQEGSIVSVLTLLGAFISGNAPDAVLALAEKLYGSTGNALKSIKALANRLELSENAVNNITGRRLVKVQQSFTLEDLYKVSLHLFSLPAAFIKLLNITNAEYRGKLISSPSHLVAQGKIVGGFLFGKQNGEGVVLAGNHGRKIIITVCGARDCFHRDYLLSAAIDRLTYPDKANNTAAEDKRVVLPSNETVIINFVGDTYFGEDYTRRRQRRGRDDALTKHGYDYCFQGIQPLLEQGDFNIVNFEAALTHKTESTLQGIKPFVLGGKIAESIASLQKNHVHAVTLGNNHAMDYGEDGMTTTLQAFRSAKMETVGLGEYAKIASEPLRIEIGSRKIIVFSGYWYRRQAHQLFELYALGRRPGVACLSGELLDRIKAERKRSKDALIITAAHWGTDFAPVNSLQRTYARQLIEAGTDLIVGHGAHMIQEIREIHGKWVLYGIGNGVFNSDGEYHKRNVPPYSFVLQMRIQNSGEMLVRLYPLFSDNLKTFWQTRPVTSGQFAEVNKYLEQLKAPLARMKVCTDSIGIYFGFKL